MKFQAAILYKQKSDLIVDDIEIFKKLKSGQLIVKVMYSGICGSQIGEINGIKGKDKFLPHLLGHEGVGKVMEISKGVKRFKVGDKVILHWKPSKGIQSSTPQYRWNKKIVNAGWITTFNDYAIVSENRLTKISKNSNYIDNILMGCAVLTGFGVALNDAKIKSGENVLIFGAGGIGLNIIQAAKVAGANNIIAVDQFTNRIELSKKTGATHGFIYGSNQYNKFINNNFQSSEIDTFIDNTGNTKVIELGYNIIKQKGKLVLVGVPKYNNYIRIHTLPIHFGKKIIGSHGGNARPFYDIPKYKKIIKKNNLMNKKLISKFYSLQNINQAIKDMIKGKIKGRAVIKNV